MLKGRWTQVLLILMLTLLYFFLFQLSQFQEQLFRLDSGQLIYQFCISHPFYQKHRLYLSKLYSHMPHSDVSVSDILHIQWWSHKIRMSCKKWKDIYGSGGVLFSLMRAISVRLGSRFPLTLSTSIFSAEITSHSLSY